MPRIQVTTTEDFPIKCERRITGKGYDAEVNINGDEFGTYGETKEKAIENLVKFVDEERHERIDLVR